MSSLFRDTAFGFFIRLITSNKFLKYPEELPGFVFPYKLDNDSTSSTQTRKSTEKKDEAGPPIGEGSLRSLVTGDEENVMTDVDLALQAVGSRAVEKVVLDEGVILVEWYGDGVFTSYC